MIPSNGFNWKHKLYVQFATLAKEAVPVSSDGRKKKIYSNGKTTTKETLFTSD